MVFLYNNDDCANCSLRKMYKIAQRRLFWSETIAVMVGSIVMVSVLAFTRQHRRLESRPLRSPIVQSLAVSCKSTPIWSLSAAWSPQENPSPPSPLHGSLAAPAFSGGAQLVSADQEGNGKPSGQNCGWISDDMRPICRDEREHPEQECAPRHDYRLGGPQL
jgi:hypothetical protein